MPSILVPPVSRRAVLGGMASFAMWANMPKGALAQGRDPRLIAIILRGGLDGLAAVPPVGDPDYAGLRADIAVPAQGDGAALPLDGFFGLNPSLPTLHALYRKGQAAVVHAAATPYRSRSHFDGQDVLESGLEKPRSSRTGWLNRAAAALPQGEQISPDRALAVSASVPLVLRGEAPVLTWTPPVFPAASVDLITRLQNLYAHTDPELARAFHAGVRGDAIVAGGAAMDDALGPKPEGIRKVFVDAAEGASRFLQRPDGPRLAALSFDGWDTHAAQGPISGRLARQLGALDAAIGVFVEELKALWQDTVIVIVTEFGRTAYENGTDGTDHGTATNAFLIGGAVKGGRVLADWPGLKPNQLFENRDLAPTTDLRAVLKGVLRDHLGLSERTLSTSVFPGSLGVKPLDGLVA